MNKREFTVTEKLFIILAWKCNGMSMGAAYESWNDHYVKKNTIEYWKDSSNQLQDWTFEIADLQQVSLEHLKFLGFRNWEKNHMLLPLWLYPQMRHEENGWFSILRDEERGLSPETDLDVRGGCLSVYFKHEPVSVIVEPERETLDQMFDDGLVLDPEAEAFINGMSGGEEETKSQIIRKVAEEMGVEVVDIPMSRDDIGMSGYLNKDERAVGMSPVMVHPYRDDEHQ